MALSDSLIQFTLSATDDASGSISGVDKAIGVLKGSLAALGAAYSVKEVASFIQGQVDAADAMGKASVRAGITVESFSQLQHAFALADIGAGELEQGFKFLNKATQDARSGNQDAIASFGQLGISLNTLKSANPNEILLEMADAISKMKDPTAQTAILMEKFGRAGVQLLPAMTEGRKGIEQLMTKADALGLTIDSEFSARAQKFNDTLKTMGQISKGAGRTIASALLPVMQDLIDGIFNTNEAAISKFSPAMKIMVTSAGWVANAILGLKSIVTITVDAIVTGFTQIGGMLGAIGAAIERIVNGDFRGATTALQDGFADAKKEGESFLARTDASIMSTADSMQKITEYTAHYGEEVKKATDAVNKNGEASRNNEILTQEQLAKRRAAYEKIQAMLLDLQKTEMSLTGDRIGATQAEYEAKKIALEQSLRDVTLNEQQKDTVRQAYAQLEKDRDLAMQQAKIQIMQDGLAILQAGHAAQNEIDDAQYALDLQKLEFFEATKQITQQQHQQMSTQALIDLKAKEGESWAIIEKNKQAFSQMSTANQLQYTANSLSSIASLMQGHGKKAFAIGKAAAVTQAVISAIASAINSYQSASAIPIVGWVLGPLAAAAALAAGMANVAKIRSTQYGASSAGGLSNPSMPSAASVSAAANTYAPETTQPSPGIGVGSPASSNTAQQRNISVHFDGSGILTPEWMRNTFVPVFNDAIGDGINVTAR